MKKLTKLAALVMTLAILLATAGCAGADISWAAKLGEESLAGGAYAYYLLAGYEQAAQLVNQNADNILREKIDGQPVVDYIVAYAKKESARALSIQEQFQSLGMTIDEAKIAEYLDYAAYFYYTNGQYLSVNRVTEEDVRFIFTTSYMGGELFYAIYGEGGEKAVPRTELIETFMGGYTRSQYLFFPKTSELGLPLTEEETAEVKAKAEGYLARAKQEGQSFSDLVHELDQSNLTEGEEPSDKLAEKEYDIYLKNLAAYYPDIYEAAIVTAEVGAIQMVEDENYIFIFKKLDIADIDEESLDYYLKQLLSDLKYDEFVALVDSWAERTDIKYNNAALGELTPKNMKYTAEQVQAALMSQSSSSGSPDSSSSSDSSNAGSSESGSSSSSSS